MYAVTGRKVHVDCLREFLPNIVASLMLCLLAGCGRPTTQAGTDKAFHEAAGQNAPVGFAMAREGLCSRIDGVLAHARDARLLNASVHGAWQVVHGILAFGPEFPLAHNGSVSSAMDYLLDDGTLKGWALRRGDTGLFAVVEEGSTTGQGHPDQWLGYLSQCGLTGIPLDTKLVVAGKHYTVNDLLTQAQADIKPGQEATWTLMALSAYLPPDTKWQARDGSTWTTERVVAMEAAADISTSACGGAHRLYGLVSALNRHIAASATDTTRERKTSTQLSGGWAAADDTIESSIQRARRFQQADGSFSIHSFDRPGTSADTFAKLSTTGHIFEVLVAWLDDERLGEPWVQRAAERLVTYLEQTADLDVECGALYHASHGLLLFRERMCRSLND